MKTLLIIVLISMISTSLFLSTQQPTSAQTYSNPYGSDDKYLTKIKVEKMRAGNLWAYIVKVCSTDRNMAISAVILKSDIDEKFLGVKDFLGKGECSYYGAVMSAKDGKTLGAEIIEMHEALEKIQSLKKELSGMSKSQYNKAMNEIHSYSNLGPGLSL